MQRQKAARAKFTLLIMSAFLLVPLVEVCAVDSPQEWLYKWTVNGGDLKVCRGLLKAARRALQMCCEPKMHKQKTLRFFFSLRDIERKYIKTLGECVLCEFSLLVELRRSHR